MRNINQCRFLGGECTYRESLMIERIINRCKIEYRERRDVIGRAHDDLAEKLYADFHEYPTYYEYIF